MHACKCGYPNQMMDQNLECTIHPFFFCADLCMSMIVRVYTMYLYMKLCPKNVILTPFFSRYEVQVC